MLNVELLIKNERTNTFLNKLLKAHRLPVVLLSILFFNNFGRPTCFIYNVSVYVNKEFSIKRLCDTKHTNFSKFTGQAKKANLINLEPP